MSKGVSQSDTLVPVKRTKVRDGLVVQWPDTHVPDHHRGAVRSLTRFIGDAQPEQVILTGDFLDCLPIGRWSADTLEEKGELFQRELDEGRRVLDGLREVYAGRVSWIPGNHEARLAKWGRTRGKALFGLRALTIPRMLGFGDLEIECPAGEIEGGPPYEFAPGVVAIHGERLGMKAGSSVTKEMERVGKSTVMGHCHRLAIVYRQNALGQIFGVEGGHLMDQRKANYLTYGLADWQMGFSVIEVVGGTSRPAVIPMKSNGSFVYQGERY